jgi:hypothetical protein
MIRILNFVFVALAGLSCLTLYHVSERTRVARVELSHVDRRIAQEHSLTNVLEAEWDRVAEPGRIQRLAEEKLGLDDSTSVQLASLELLPRRGEDAAPLTSSRIRKASDVVAARRNPNIRNAAVRTGM